MDAHPTADVKTNLGAILLGGFISMALSGVVACQAFLYFRMYGDKDKRSVKLLVYLVWALDAVHTALIAASLWDYFALSFGEQKTDYVNVETALTVAFTATITFIVHLFFAYRVLRLSKYNWWCTGPITALAFCRLIAAIVSTYELASLASYSAFAEKAGWVFTLGLALSATLDVLITAAMFYYLQMSRTGFERMDHLIDTLLLYTFNNGALTSVATIAALVCWLCMRYNLIFLGIHLSIAKLYAISLLITLNTRYSIRQRARLSDREEDGHQLPVLVHGTLGHRKRSFVARFPSVKGSERPVEPTSTQVSVTIERSVHFDHVDGDITEADEVGVSPSSEVDECEKRMAQM
ncbi:unnamed protein product [Peniophora sp. CBMAI 1063]|nr:unnamed protein product [Peniophora sp. CBMAI 1063]